ncbi:peptidoglycan D,D-transpeptidase FtsI family protein [Candidatus Collinsella stercoripullorum]|uniref:peptidoglycan D,D-transpeptidase FtsI family protein n=1 Tax=Candidatus Collinsella stercoripullorum TaxID=2838522 RepID=UPI0022E13B29|nr:penicillin-binding protein 2 [Candidatus Collinsella stercoripullorum]
MQDRRDPNRGRRAPADRRPGYRTDPRCASRPPRTGAGASSPLQNPTRRTVVKGLLGLGMGLGVFKLAQHQIFYRDANMTRLEGRRLLTPTLYAKRGTLYDRNGNVLAASEECMNIALNTKQITDADAVVDALVDHLGVERSYAREKVGEDTTWTYVKMKVDTEVAEALLDEGLAGVEYEHAMKRVYPYGTLASQVLGVVGSDNVGISGLELQYEDELQGENGWMVRERAADGTYIAGGAYEKQDARDGSDLVLTLDINIQRAAEDALAEAVASSGANYGSVIVTDPATGDILAACSYPTYDPADLSTARTEDMNLRVVTDAYEPGSVFKALVCGMAIDLGLVDTETTFTVPAAVMAGDDEVTDVDDRDYTMTMTVREIMRRSSNTGMILVGEKVGADRFAEYLSDYGIGEKSGVDFPGENTGIVKERDEYDGASVAAMSFGQSVSVCPVELVRAVSAIANKGVMTTPHFLKSRHGEEEDWTAGQRRVLDEQTAEKVADMMLTVVDEGTGALGQVEGYEVSGKTGTAQRASEEGGYQENSYMASFMGFAPTSAPKAQVYVTLDGTAYNSSVAAGPFSTVMEAALDALGVKPTR